MNYLRIPREITLLEILENDASLSPGTYRRVEIPSPNTKRVKDLLADYQNGIEVGSISYMHQPSSYNFIRTKALQPHSNLTQSRGDAIIPILPRAYKKAIADHPNRAISDGDILYARGGNVGEVAIATKCGTAIISGHMLRLIFAAYPYYCFAFMKHDICKLQQQPSVKGSIRALDNFNINTLLDCLIPFPNQPDASHIVQYVAALMQTIVDKEKIIIDRSREIQSTIQLELESKQQHPTFQFQYPSINEIRQLGRFDAAIYDREYKSKIWLIENYTGGFTTPKADGFTITPGPSLEMKIIRTRLDSDVYKPGFYTLILPMNISEYGTMNVIAYLGTGKKLPLLRAGDIVFGEAGFHKGRSIVLLDGIENCTTNAHGLYARRADGDLQKSIFFRCIFNWYRSMRLIDLMAVGGSGGHFSPEYFDYLRIPRFPDAKQQEIAHLYHNPAAAPVDAPTLGTFVDWHRRWNTMLGIWELDREMKNLQRTLAAVQEQIIEGQTVSVPI